MFPSKKHPELLVSSNFLFYGLSELSEIWTYVIFLGLPLTCKLHIPARPVYLLFSERLRVLHPGCSFLASEALPSLHFFTWLAYSCFPSPPHPSPPPPKIRGNLFFIKPIKICWIATKAVGSLSRTEHHQSSRHQHLFHQNSILQFCLIF